MARVRCLNRPCKLVTHRGVEPKHNQGIIENRIGVVLYRDAAAIDVRDIYRF